ncbi:hypothetical protein LEN26_005859 [Aphanomyces euteiches]|nr:hypothetical protein LEN26_005859 [Aphanomyces euteiches]
MHLTEELPLQDTPTDVETLQPSDTKLKYACQICLEIVDLEIIITGICGPTCLASVCVDCLAEYIDVRTQSLPRGVLAKLNCPICNRPVNETRWKERCPHTADLVDVFADRVAASCTILCPSCHSQYNALPCPVDQGLNVLVNLQPSYLEKLPALDEICRLYCQHEISPDALCQFVRDAFPNDHTEVNRQLLLYIHDTERRASLFLRLTREQPFIRTSCCSADICFTCKTKDHHHGVPCQARTTTNEEIAACPSCNLTLVKGDGCDQMTCFCGSSFSWRDQVQLRRWSMIPRSRLTFFAAAFSRFVWLRRFRKSVLPALRRKVNMLKFKSVYLAVCTYLRGMVHRRLVQRSVLPELVFVVAMRKFRAQFIAVCEYFRAMVRRTRRNRRLFPEMKSRVFIKNLREEKKPMLAVREYLRSHAWKKLFTKKVLLSKEFYDAVLLRKSSHCFTTIHAFLNSLRAS